MILSWETFLPPAPSAATARSVSAIFPFLVASAFPTSLLVVRPLKLSLRFLALPELSLALAVLRFSFLLATLAPGRRTVALPFRRRPRGLAPDSGPGSESASEVDKDRLMVLIQLPDMQRSRFYLDPAAVTKVEGAPGTFRLWFHDDAFYVGFSG